MPTTDAAEHDKSGADSALPDYPGEDFLAHSGSHWLELAEARLTTAGLLHVANGYPPHSVGQIIDVDLTALPMLPIGHRD